MSQQASAQRVVITGGGGHDREVLDVYEANAGGRVQHDVLGFLADGAMPRSMVNDKPVLGGNGRNAGGRGRPEYCEMPCRDHRDPENRPT